MTVDLFAGASSNKVSDWEAVNWPKIRHDVRRLQLRIAKAIRAGKYGKAQVLVVAAHTLALGQAIGRQAGDGKQGCENTRCR